MATAEFSTLLLWLGAFTVILADVLLIVRVAGPFSPPRTRQAWLLTPFGFAMLSALLTPARWLALGLLGLAVIVHGAGHLAWLRGLGGAIGSAPDGPVARVEALRRRWQVQCRVRVCVDRTEGASPAMLGLWQQTLVLPGGWESRSDDREFEAVVAHELAHAERRDPLRIWLLGLLRSLLGWHPLARRALDHLALEIELEADRQAASWLDDRRAYALALARWADQAEAAARSGAGARLAGRPRTLLIRLRVLLDPTSPAPHLSLPRPLAALDRRSRRGPGRELPAAFALAYQGFWLALFEVARRLW
ncbi:M56 family metallopeptidase [Limnochorda pilosa]|uniref:Peptidase M56 domain-containing protein n=1 Tax=Limnochorda pilosa TaxID=1555112 RepID=A0A0K2SII1_LIMPI|nr:M56 family metallopeptidase [Limnochorda pilosa]BAS26895.1 hypothetical protein LIP_1038 [Limnochorda pilosa]